LWQARVDVITYRVEGLMLIVAKSGTSTLEERAAIFDALRADPAVPTGALLLLDLRHIEESLDSPEFGRRLLGLRDALGLKLGAACAVLVHDRHEADARAFKGLHYTGVRLAMFTDEAVARNWLNVFIPPSA
jgi:hypothetical protein